MQFYDKIISEVLQSLDDFNLKNLNVFKNTWTDARKDNMVLRSDSAFELGGSGFASLGFSAVTSNENLCANNEIILLGQDIPEISADTNYARVTIAKVNPQIMGEKNSLYNSIKQIENVKYHVSPKGFMLRISAINKTESARISKEALNDGINFETVGNFMIEKYLQIPAVEAVKIIFINDDNYDYDALKKNIAQTHEITNTIDHMLKDIIMDCDTCSQAQICDEVEGLRQLHFSNKQEEKE